jgi:predicted tellurium resistance membrane protein TerC
MLFEWILLPEAWIALVTLIALEIVLGDVWV